MFVLVNFICVTLFFFGIIGFEVYTYLWDFYDTFSAYVDNSLNKVENEYDYIVVGAGSAGSVIAARLSENPNVSVLVLEAGAFGGKLLDIPAIAPILHKTIYDWQYDIVPQEHACGAFENNGSPWPLGKIIGGSGRLNNMMYTRGHPDDFKEWYKDLEGYDYEYDVLRYFKRAENQIGSFSNDSKYHSLNGPLTVNDLVYASEMFEAVARTAADMGFPVRDVNGEFSSGFSQPQVNVKRGSRYSTGHYLLECRHRSNLFIKIFSHVQKILFKGDYEAYAVQHEILNKMYITRARKAIVLSAGVVGTPKLLMLSGIGKTAHLKEIGIRPIKNLPVGNNLQDHISTGFDLVLLDSPLDINFYSLSSPINHFKYFFQSRGPLTSTGCEVFAILQSNCLNGTKYELCERNWGRPDLELLFLPVGVSSDHGIRFKEAISLKKNSWSQYFSHLTSHFVMNILPVVLHPKSVGTVRLKDKNPFTKPIINPNYLSDPSDIEILIQSLQFVKKITENPHMRELGVRLNNLKFPGCEDFDFASENYWRCYIKYVTFTLYHPVGTCKMGSEHDSNNVVNYDFKVMDTNKLYVADASVMPSLVSANINAAVVMLAEKVVDVLKKYRRLEIGGCYRKDIFLKTYFCII